VDSNQQRENLLPSEKAFSYKMKLEAIKRQGQRADLTSGQVGPKYQNTRSNVELAAANNESVKQIQRYIRLTNLLQPILKMVDEKTIAFNPAVELSYLPEEAQNALFEAIEVHQCTPSLSQAQRMKTLHQQGKLELKMIPEILSEIKANQREKISFSHEKLKRYFPKGYTPQQMEESIIKLLEDRQRKLKRDREIER
jgi:ParB family chromosome partitioning protein